MGHLTVVYQPEVMGEVVSTAAFLDHRLTTSCFVLLLADWGQKARKFYGPTALHLSCAGLSLGVVWGGN
jgi:hypothetical protein